MLMISLSRYISKILLIGFLLGAPALSASSVKISSDIRSFLSDNCINCHGPKKQKGSIRLDSIPTTIAEEADQPTHQSLTQFIESLTQDLRDARLQLVDTGGRNMNRREYEQTPTIVAGHSGGGMNQGQHYVFESNQTPLANLWLSLLNQVGVNATSFADSDGKLPGLFG